MSATKIIPEALKSYSETTVTREETKVQATEDRIVNILALDKLKSFAFCTICQEMIMPAEKKPVICIACNNAVYCSPCIDQWKKSKGGRAGCCS